MAIVDVHYYKASGKFYTDAEVDIGDISPWDVDRIKEILIEKKIGVTNPTNFHAVVRSRPQGDFIDMLIMIGTW